MQSFIKHSLNVYGAPGPIWQKLQEVTVTHKHTHRGKRQERKDSKRKASKTEDPILIYGDRVYRVIVAD